MHLKQTVAIIALTIVLLSQSHMAWAVWQLPVINYTQSDYNAGTQNWSIEQNAQDWLYVANKYGLLEYDGSRWNLYGLTNKSPLFTIHCETDGTVFCGATNEYGFFSPNEQGMLIYNSLSAHLPTEQRNFGDVWKIHVLKGIAYFETRNCIMTYSLRDSTSRRIESPSNITASVLMNNNIYVANSEGIYCLRGDELTNCIEGSAEVAHHGIRQMVMLNNKHIYIGTERGGLFVTDGKEVHRLKTEADAYIGENMFFCLAVNETHIAVGTVTGGVAMMDIDGTNPRYINVDNGLQNNTVLSVYFDRNGELWCGLDQGVDMVQVSSAISQLYAPKAPYGTGYAALICNNKLYIGTNRGLYVAQWPLDNKETIFSAEAVEGCKGQVWSLALWNGDLYCCHDRGLFIVRPNRKIETVSSNEGFWQLRSLQGRADVAVVGGYNGLYKLEGGKLTKIENAPKQAKTFELDSSNRVWISTNRGIERLTMNSEFTRSANELLLKGSEDPQDYQNILKLDGHIVVSHGKKSYITDDSNNLSNDEGLLTLCDGNNTFYDLIVKDDDGYVWWIANNALKVRKINKRTGQYDTRSTQVLHKQNFYVYGFMNAMTMGNGQLCINSVQGFARADAEKIIANQKSANGGQGIRPFIRQMTVINEGSDGEKYGIAGIGRQTKIELPYESNSVRITFGCPPMSVEMNRFACTLSGNNDTEIKEETTANAKEYTFLSPGKYTFRVEGMRADGSLSLPTDLTFYVLPPWYQTWWAYTLMVLAALSLLALGFQLTRRHYRKTREQLAKRKEQEMQEQQRDFARQALERDKEILRLQNAKIEDELKSKGEELSQMMLNTISRNEFITKIKRDVQRVQEDLQSNEVGIATKRLQQLQVRLSKEADTRINWDTFERNFDRVNDLFMSKLQARFTWISANEKRLCVYIVMGLMNKEIAPLMNITVRGVEMLRYRMRKKMELQREDDLEQLLQSVGGSISMDSKALIASMNADRKTNNDDN